MPNAVYSLLLVFVFLVIVTAVLKTDLLGYVGAVGIIFAFMVVLHHYLALQMIGYAVQTASPYLRYFFFRSAVTVGGAAPLLLLAVAWLARERFKPWLFYATAAAVAYSGLWTGYDEFARLAPLLPALFAGHPVGLRRYVRSHRRRGSDRAQPRRTAQGPSQAERRTTRAPRRLGAPWRKQLVSDRTGEALIR
jgi:hypothetical protein